MIYIFLADGFEECEALVPLDLLRRADIEVLTVGVTSKTVTGSHGISVICDKTTEEITKENLTGIILPGGMPGTINLENNKTVQDYIDYSVNNNLLIAAICAAPSILGHKNLLNNKKATCFTGFEKDLYGAIVETAPVICDGDFITAYGAGAAFEFGFAIITKLLGSEKTEQLKKQIRYI